MQKNLMVPLFRIKKKKSIYNPFTFQECDNTTNYKTDGASRPCTGIYRKVPSWLTAGHVKVILSNAEGKMPVGQSTIYLGTFLLPGSALLTQFTSTFL